jgi:SulP family sulfate permease
MAGTRGATFLRRFGAGMLPPDGLAVGHDLAASFALAAIAIPEQLATARLAGLPPVTGLVVFIAGSLGFFLLGANRCLSVGADSTIAPIFAGGLALMAAAGSSHYAALAAALAVLVGALVAASGALRLGWIARLLSIPVVTGFLAGIAIHIAVSQLPGLLGLANPHGDFVSTLSNLARNIGHSNPYTATIGLTVLAIALACEKIDARLPGALMAMTLATIAVGLFNLAGKGVAILGRLQAVSLAPSLPGITVTDAQNLLPTALLISLVVIIQTAATSRSFLDETGSADINKDLMGVGLGNILSGFAGAFPANCSPPRSAIAHESGARSRFAGLCAGLIVAGFLLLGLKLLADVPDAALAGLLLFVAMRIFRTDVMKTIAAQSPAEFALLAATAAAMVLTPIETGVGIGIALSLLHGVWTIAQTRAIPFEKVPGSTVWWPAGPHFAGERLAGIVVVGFQAPLFFLNADTFRKSLDQAVLDAPTPTRAIILEGSSIVELDFSGAQILISMIQSWKSRGVEFFIARLESVRAQQALEKFGILALLGEQRIFHSVDDAVRHLSPAR